MKKFFTWFFALLLVLAIGGAFFYLYKKSQSKPTVYKTEMAEIADITKKTVATGSIVPRREVEVKPKVTGVLAELYVEPGKKVKQGDPLGKIAIIADAMQVNQAESGVRTTQIAFENAKRELARNEALFKQGVVADAELQRYRTEFALRKQELATAGSSLQLVKEGATRGQSKTSTLIVTATTDGTVIDVPVKEGFSVIQANNFNPGTTVAVIADMEDIIFQGRVDEAEVAKIKEGMKLSIKVGAIEKDMLEGKLEYISPKGKEIDGAIQFEIKAKVVAKPGVQIRANYSANADIVLDEKKQVLAIREALVQYKDEKPFVEVETAPQTFDKRDVKLGLSDGIKVEVLSGVTKTDKIKIPDNAGPAGAMGGGKGGGKGGKPPAKK
ncbi:MAG: efflux RND transporter periplasmic adaptor subunit [Deltaproteobacteria bacterium]|nr:efflux RND transporter periplasmic adaptor subunit [Deltaproteobacteria bacterium]MDQ3296488.1 efflux RND transporter periplasmic adaptor subunit [Myxococcota bacterium]